MPDLPPLISTEELASRLGEPDLRLVDASWHLDGRDGRPDFEAARLPGAVFFDLEASSDPDSDLPHMLPSPEAFTARMGRLGLSETDHIVVYDTVGIRSSARAWWMFRVMGASRVQVLDGGLPKWRTEGRTVESGPPSPSRPAVFSARLDPAAVADIEAVSAALAGEAQILDARAADRFAGYAPEPRAGLRSGHMPGALNLPFPQVLASDGAIKPQSELEAAFREAGVDPRRPVITTCGSGVTAAILSLALATLGRGSRLYDGSWAEWGSRTDTPVVKAAGATIGGEAPAR
ncbi:3-mercaptopyruvate sulfurtransferase [Roseibacterium beibuensis]|uniref:3-mercaptopyruvate sulfurtransferase n=1 Tax=[Roseibacterium] beibuensis TaxID=1193142 RepID=UPI00217DE972|nr:3-mercaptopyruvate sulfurtransferase [Roseibacterium beibuensis]MCS6625228.1 3-mercaptopyruvate sulfurtransferase [Roseibacterium beibuensis]